MGPRAWKAVTRADALSPAVGRRMVGAFLRFMSPFNAPLRARVEAWEPSLCRVRVPPRRALTNHLGGVHACALATAGETPAGLLLLKSFPLDGYRLILKDLSVTYERQARGEVVAEARLAEEAIARVRAGLERGEAQLVPVQTTLSNRAGDRLAVVHTTWQLKSWEQVRKKR